MLSRLYECKVCFLPCDFTKCNYTIEKQLLVRRQGGLTIFTLLKETRSLPELVRPHSKDMLRDQHKQGRTLCRLLCRLVKIWKERSCEGFLKPFATINS